MTAYTFSQLIDFTRTSSATYVDSAGKIVPTAASRNLLTFTQEFDNAGWAKNNAAAYPLDPATATQGPELVVNGDFSGGSTGWTVGDWVISSGQAAATATSTSLYGGQFTPVANRVYRVEFDVVSYTSGTLSITVGGNFTTNVNLTGAAMAPGRKSVLVVAGSSPARAVEFFGGSITAVIDNISVKELSGGLIAAPDGTFTADALIESAAAGVHYVSETVTGTAVGTTYTASVYAKPNGRNWIILEMSGATIYASFNVATGVVGTTSGSPTTTITPVGNGWYRCSMTKAIGAGISAIRVYTASADNTTSYTGDGTSGVFVWGAQLEAVSAATDYTRNVGGVYPPRFDYDPVTLAPRGLLVEEQRTNLLTYSEQFDNAAWTKQNVTATANSTTSPDGTVDADSVVENTAADVHRIQQSTTVTSGTAYAISVFAKPIGSRRLYINSIAVGGAGALFDLTGDGSVVNVAGTAANKAATIQAVGNGWYRCTLIGTGTGTASAILLQVNRNTSTTASDDVYTGDGTSGLYIWGAQLEVGAFATSYIPTVASQVTRTADVATITGANFSQWYNQSEGTFVVDAAISSSNNLGNRFVFQVDAGTDATRMLVVFDPSVQAVSDIGTVRQALLDGGTPGIGTYNKVALSYKLDDYALSLNGGAVVTDNTGNVPTVDTLRIGNGASGTVSIFGGHIRSIRYYPTRLSNAQLQALTA